MGRPIRFTDLMRRLAEKSKLSEKTVRKVYNNLFELKYLLIDNGWTIFTAISVIILFLFHYPCSTACLTIKKETNSWYYTFLSMIIPTIIGLGMCLIVKVLFAFLG